MTELQIVSFTEIEEDDWTDFHKSCYDPVVFYQYPFLNAYKEATGNEVSLLLYKKNNNLLVVLPGIFDQSKRIFYNLTYLGWDNLNYLMVKEIDPITLENFFTELSRMVDLVVYKNISESCHKIILSNTAESIKFKGFRCPYIFLKDSYMDYLGNLSVSFKRMIKNRTNFCIKHEVEFRFLTDSDSGFFEEAFSELNRLHGIRMDEVDLESKFLKSDSQKFHQILRKQKSKDFILIVQAVEGDKVIGTLYGFVSSNRYVYFAAGIDPDYSKYSLGIVLIGKVIEYSISKNYEYFDFLRGTEDYKFKWTQETNQNYTIYSPSNFSGKAKALKVYWDDNKHRIGRRQTLLNFKRFL